MTDGKNIKIFNCKEKKKRSERKKLQNLNTTASNRIENANTFQLSWRKTTDETNTHGNLHISLKYAYICCK